MAHQWRINGSPYRFFENSSLIAFAYYPWTDSGNGLTIQNLLGQKFLQLWVLVFQSLQPFGVRNRHPAKLRQHRSAYFAPASCSVKMPMICSSLYLVRFIVRPFVGSDCNSKSRKNPVAGLAQQESRQAQHYPITSLSS